MKHQEPEPIHTDEERVSGEYIVTLKEAGTEESLHKVFSPHDLASIEKITDNIFLIHFKTDPAPSEIQTFLDNENIVAIQPNFKYKVESEERSPTQYHD